MVGDQLWGGKRWPTAIGEGLCGRDVIGRMIKGREAQSCGADSSAAQCKHWDNMAVSYSTVDGHPSIPGLHCK